MIRKHRGKNLASNHLAHHNTSKEFTPYIVSPSRIRDLTGVISRSRAYVLEQSDPGFPKRVRLSPSNTGWRYSELIAYIERRSAS